jgi:putative membrane protein
MKINKIIPKLGSTFKNQEHIILRDFLALERTKLANERTLLSYIRASLYLLLGGIALLKLDGFEQIKFLGYTSLGLTVIILVIGIFRYHKLKRKLRNYYGDMDLQMKLKQQEEEKENA